MEPLEIRCNLSVIDALAGEMAEPIVVPCDVVETGVYEGLLDAECNSDREGSSDVTWTDDAGWTQTYPTD